MALGAKRSRSRLSYITNAQEEPRERVQSRAYASPQRLPTRYPPITRETNISVAAAHPQPPHSEEEDGRASGSAQWPSSDLFRLCNAQYTPRLSAVSHNAASDEAFSVTGAPAPRHLAAEQASSAAVLAMTTWQPDPVHLSSLWGTPATQLPSPIDRSLPSTARVQEVFATRMLMGLAVPAELQRRSA